MRAAGEGTSEAGAGGRSGSRVGAIVAMMAVGVAVSAALAQPGEEIHPRTCNANQCVLNDSTLVWCELNTYVGCCCKFTGQTTWSCQCVDETTCLTSSDCHANSAG